MPEREVESVEVVARRLDLTTVDDAVAEAEEDVLDLPANLGDQMEVAAMMHADGQGDVDSFLGEPGIELGAGDLGLPPVDRRLEPFADRVQRACPSRDRAPRAVPA